jgi:hypothetical protein
MVTVFLCVALTGLSQDIENRKLMDEMNKLQSLYLGVNGLSFGVKYLYASESNPRQYLDSLKGEMDIAGNRFRIVLDNTETVMNEKYLIHVFKEDKLLYLSAPANSVGNENPVSLLSSAFAAIKNLTYTIESANGLKTITVNFPSGLQYKKMAFVIDSRTGLLSKVKYVVKTGQLMDANTYTGGDEYSIVECLFLNYKAGITNLSLFDEKDYFFIKDNQYKPTEKYKDYSIFLGSPNL